MAEEGISNFENWDKRLTPKTLSHHLTYATKKSTKFRQLFDRVLERKETAMEDVEKTREELIAELAASQRQIGALEGEVVKLQMAEEKLRRLNMVLRAIRNINQLIARGAERSQLLDGVCQSLIENRGYYSAWVVLLDKAGRYVASAQAGLGAEFADLQKRLELGELPPCARKALETPHAVVIGVTKELCAGCPLEGVEKDGSKMSIRLTHGSQMYGVMTVVALPGTAGDSEEQELLEEVAADVAFALHSLEMEEARRKAEEELRSSEERYRAVVETAAEGIIVSQGDKIVFANRRALAMSGCTMEELRTMSPFAIYHPDDREKVRDRFRRWRQGEGLPRWFPLRVLSKDGSVRWVVVGLARIVWQGAPAVVSLMSDITEQVAKEEELRKSEERYCTLVDGSAEAIVVVQDDRVVFANRMALRVGGYTLEELQQTTLWDLFHPDDLEKARSRFQKWLKGERMPRYYPLRLVMKDGSSRWVLFSVVSITWDGRPALLVLMEDVTEQKRLEDMLIESERRYRTVLEEMQDAYYETDLRGKLTFFSDVMAQWLGYSPQELTGMDYRQYVPEEERDKIFNTFNQVYRTGVPLRGFRATHITKDGRKVPVEYSVLPLRNEKGETIGFRGIVRDISERVRMEEELRKSEERYRTILEETDIGYYEVDLRGNLLFANDAYLRRLPAPRERIIGLNYRAFISESDWEGVFNRFNEVYRTGQPSQGVLIRVVTPDGEERLFENSVFPMRNEKGETIGFRGISRDVTEQLRMEEALRKSEERFRTVLEEVDEGYYETDLRGSFTFVTDAMMRQLGYSRDELIGMNYRAYVPQEEWDAVFKAFNEVYRTGNPLKRFGITNITKDGRRILIEDTVLPLRNEKGETIGFRGISRDVTEQRRMEEALRKSEERFRTVLDEMEDSYFELDIAGNFTFVNDALCRTMGYSREEILGKNYRMLTAEDDWEKLFKFFNQVYRERRPQKGIIFKTIRKDGSTGVGELVALPMRDEKGEVIGFRGVGRDISERIKAEEERKELERRAHLAARLASVGEMASGIAHEINNPLTGVIGYAQLLLARKDLPEDIRPALEVINDSAQRVASIIRRLLTFARQYKPERRQVLINEVVEAALRLRTYHLQTSNIKVTTQFARDLPVTIADAGQLQQVFLNIIMNAEAAMKQIPRQGRLLVKTELVDPDIIRISFKDNGPGIAPEHLERIFEPFFTTSEVGEGTGLGLSVCHGIITEHKGRIWAESQPGKGATFFIDLPVVTAVVEEPVVKEVEKPSPLRKARVLVVDDEPVVREFVSQVLSAEGYEVDTAGNAEEALERVRSRRYRLILLDIKMPGTSGIELYQQFRSLIPALARRTLFITGDVMGASTRDFLTRTRAPYIAKPFDASKLVGEVRRALSRS